MIEPEEERDPFEQFENLAPLAAYLADRHSAKLLRECLRSVEGLTSEFLQDAAAELRQVGLHKVASILSAEAAKRPSSLDVDNPYDPKDQINWQYWQDSWQRRRNLPDLTKRQR